MDRLALDDRRLLGLERLRRQRRSVGGEIPNGGLEGRDAALERLEVRSLFVSHDA